MGRIGRYLNEETVFMAAIHLSRPLSAICLLAALLPSAGFGEIYKWVDSKGRVHFSDKRNANEAAKPIDSLITADPGGNEFLFHPEADVTLRQGDNQASGDATLLSVGNGNHQEMSLLRFEISPLLAELHRNPSKKLLSATLLLYANTEDKPQGQEAPGHMGSAADTAFYLKPTHNNFAEQTITWEQFFNQNHYTPAAIRRLPSAAMPGSEDAHQNYSIDLMPLMEQLTAGNLRLFTLEMRLQRATGDARINLYSREAAVEKRPALRVLLGGTPSTP
jgi:hypothetical protein